MIHSKPLVLASILVALPSFVSAIEMPRSLRDAERLYANGRYAEASDKAKEFQKLYPNNVQALIILGMSDFYLNNYKDSVRWFKRADQLSPKHPIVTQYMNLLKELEYRSGPFSIEPSEADFTDPETTAEFYKRGYFNTAYPSESQKDEPGASTKLLDPVLITEHISTPTLRLESELALPNPGEATASLFSETYMEKMAREALVDKKYEKAYLFYSQLSASDPNNKTYRIEQAEAAFYLKRYAKVMEILLPISSKASLDSLTDFQKDKAKKLLDMSANKRFVPGKE